jgi:hypothetical protein
MHRIALCVKLCCALSSAKLCVEFCYIARWVVVCCTTLQTLLCCIANCVASCYVANSIVLHCVWILLSCTVSYVALHCATLRTLLRYELYCVALWLCWAALHCIFVALHYKHYCITLRTPLCCATDFDALCFASSFAALYCKFCYVSSFANPSSNNLHTKK